MQDNINIFSKKLYFLQQPTKTNFAYVEEEQNNLRWLCEIYFGKN